MWYSFWLIEQQLFFLGIDEHSLIICPQPYPKVVWDLLLDGLL